MLLVLVSGGCQEKTNTVSKEERAEKNIQKIEEKNDKRTEDKRNEDKSILEELVEEELLYDDVNEPKYVIRKSEMNIDADDNVLSTRKSTFIYRMMAVIIWRRKAESE